MPGENVERAIDIDNEIEATEQNLVLRDYRQSSAGEAVDHEGRNAHRVELMHPRFDIGADAARSVHQHHDGEAPRALRDAKFAGDSDGFAIGIAGQELLVGYG